jgi:hypothetical protein
MCSCFTLLLLYNLSKLLFFGPILYFIDDIEDLEREMKLVPKTYILKSYPTQTQGDTLSSPFQPGLALFNYYNLI